jgi:excisionase family DNA binding protein
MARLLTADEVAEQLRVGKSFIYDQARAGQLPHVKVGRYVRFHQDDLDAWVDGQRVASTNGRRSA